MSEPPIEIALIGAPGSGKSELARSLVSPLTDGVVDNYTDILVRADVPVGIWADMYINMWIWFLRESEDAKVRPGTNTMVTCGSGLDTLAYGHLHLEGFEGVFPSKTLQEQIDRAILSMKLLTDFITARMNKDLMYILPLQTEDSENPDDHFNHQVDKKIREINLSVGLNIPMLTDTVEENSERIKKDVKDLAKVRTTVK